MKKTSWWVTLVMVASIVGLTAGPASAATCNVPGDYATIQAAVNDPSCDPILVAPGTYPENVTINRAVTLDGSGQGATFVDPPANGPALSIGASNVVVSNLTTTGAAGTGNTGAGVWLTGSISNVAFESMGSRSNGGYGIAINSSGTMSGISLDDVNSSDNGGAGFRVPASLTSLNGLSVTNSSLERNPTGLEIFITASTTAPLQSVSNVLVEDTSLDANLNKGAYIERLDNAIFRRVSVVGSGASIAAPAFDAGIDLNLKFLAYQNVRIEDSIVTDNGAGDPTNGVGIGIKARDDTGHALYGVRPASLSGVWVSNTQVERNTSDGIRLGEVAPAQNNNSLSDVHVNLSSIENNTSFGMNNRTPTIADGECNWWGSPSGPTTSSNPGGTGDEVSTNVDYQPWETAENGACNGPIVTPPNKDACKKDGWMAYTDDQGRPFKNQGDCQSYFASAGKNKAAG